MGTYAYSTVAFTSAMSARVSVDGLAAKKGWLLALPTAKLTAYDRKICPSPAIAATDRQRWIAFYRTAGSCPVKGLQDLWLGKSTNLVLANSQFPRIMSSRRPITTTAPKSFHQEQSGSRTWSTPHPHRRYSFQEHELRRIVECAISLGATYRQHGPGSS